ncbi:carbamoyltransferase HypF [Lutimonas sp.]|uniref:carbamoyltransferase HypF n=1 Tax=Lutimonas sp. TaxID=1872403 RepID=UPI003C75F365
MHKTYRIIINGRVQGVGFRPYVSKLAKSMGLAGNVSNNEFGVVIFASGEAERVTQFYKQLIKNPPPVARIKAHEIIELDWVHYDSFEIIPTQTKGKLNLALTPDFAICQTCCSEIADPQNRRFMYPFTTCVNCGPRWSITNTFPFERAHTSIHEFSMCPACKTEYTDPDDRRFHSQTNSCPKCGIILELEDHQGNHIKADSKQIFKRISKLIGKGKILAVKNTGGYLLCCDAGNPEVIDKLRRLKRRPKKPFAILYPSIDLLKKEIVLDHDQITALTSPERPIVIVSSKGFKGQLALNELAPGLGQLGVMLPYSGILELLGREFGRPLVATSGNIHGSPIISEKDKALELISHVADYFLHHNLSILNAQDDSVIKFSFRNRQRVLFRRSRGFAPNYFDDVPRNKTKVLALGGHLKSTIAFAPNDYLYLSQYLGNLDHYEVYARFVETIAVFMRIFKETPDCILVDKHPAYLSTQYGEELSMKIKVPLYKIQHHMAHFASVLAEHQLFEHDRDILGVVWDGTGYGDDGQIWGGEFFGYQDGDIIRTGHFEYFDWLAGDKMSKEPRLSLFSLNNDPKAAFLKDKFSAQEIAIYSSIKTSNKLQTSSVGRIFDALASLLGFCDMNSYEGEGAILLENAVQDYDPALLKIYVRPGDDGIVPTNVLWANLFKDFLDGLEKEEIILNFLFTLANVIIKMAELKGTRIIALSGGVFQNTVLVDMVNELSENKFELFFNRNLAPNDENIAIGQLMYYTHCIDQQKKE